MMIKRLKSTAKTLIDISFRSIAATFLLCMVATFANAQKTFTVGQKVAIKDDFDSKWYLATYKGKLGALHEIEYTHTTVIGGKTYDIQVDLDVPENDILSITDPTYKTLKIENETSATASTTPPIPVNPPPVNLSNDEVVVPKTNPTTTQPSTPTPTPVANPTTTSTIDIIFAYTKEALAEAGGPAALKAAFIDDGIIRLNEALNNSETKVQTRAVPMMVEVDNVKAPTTQAEALALLAELSKPDGDFAQLHKFRKDKNADIICFIFNGSYPSAWANLGKLPASMNQSRAAMIMPLKAFGSSLVFGHEFGHILGCAHQKETDGATAYAAGYNPGQGWKTIEANGGYTIPYFSAPRTVKTSNPGYTSYNGQPAELNILIGNAGTADCSRCIRENGQEYSKFSDNLPVITAAGKYTSMLVNPVNNGVTSLPFSKAYNGTSSSWVFNVVKGKKYIITVENLASSAAGIGFLNFEGSDATGKQRIKFAAATVQNKAEEFTASTDGLFSVLTTFNNNVKSYQIQIKAL